MSTRAWMGAGIVAGAAAGLPLIRRRLRATGTAPELAPVQARQLLERAAPLLRLPTSLDRPPEVLPDGSGPRYPTTGHVYPYRNGILDLLPESIVLTETQHVLNTPLSAWAYDRGRDLIVS